MPGQLRDIRGLDAVSWWPPAPGWWIGALLLLLTLIGLFLLIRHFIRYRRKLAVGGARRAARTVAAA